MRRGNHFSYPRLGAYPKGGLVETAYNYSSHAVQDLKAFKLGSRYVPCLADLLDKPIKFMMPDDAAVIDHTKSVDIMDASLLMLPYPVCALEFPINEAESLCHPCYSSKKRIALCANPAALVGTPLENFVRDRESWKAMVGAQRGVVLMGANCQSATNSWMPLPYLLLIPQDQTIGNLYTFKNCTWTASDRRIGVEIVPLQTAVELDWLEILAGFSAEYYPLVNFLTVLSCQNVVTEELPAPKKLNKKRISSPPPPLYGYRAIVVKPHTEPAASEAGAGSHASPRTHLRRGHIRRLGHKNIWIQNTIVNAGRNEVKAPFYRVLGS